MQAEALIDTLADMQEQVQAKTVGDTLGDVEAEALVLLTRVWRL